MRTLYLVHDLADPAVARRVTMLKCGGAAPVVAGFYRTCEAPEQVAGAPAIALGRTHDARLLQRAGMVARHRLAVGGLARKLGPFDAILARNLEMLTLAAPLARSAKVQRLAYEVLDIHRLTLGRTAKARILRAVETRAARNVDVVLTSSPAFVRHYFEPLSGIAAPIQLVENKVLAEPHERPAAMPASGPPWRIGLLGALRCRRSVDTLKRLAAALAGRIEVVVRGRPSPAIFADLEGELRAAPNVTFAGPYAPHELPAIYGSLHFVWAIDHFEAGANSEWLLPNRLYEGLYYGAIPIARPGTQTARLLRALGAGLVLEEPALCEFFSTLSAARAERERRAVDAIPPRRLAAGLTDCRALVAAIRGPNASAGFTERAAA